MPRDREHEQRIARRQNIIEHDPETAFHSALKVPNWRRLRNVEDAEKHEGCDLPLNRERHERKDEEVRHDFIPHHSAVIAVSERAARDLARPHADCEPRCERDRVNDRVEVARSAEKNAEREKRAECARREGTETGAAAERDEMRRMAEEESDGRTLAAFTRENGRTPRA